MQYICSKLFVHLFTILVVVVYFCESPKIAFCRIDGEAIVAGNNETKIESMKEWQNFLRRVFQLH